MSSGVVRMIGRANGFRAVFTDQGEYTIVEPLGATDLELGDSVRGDLESLGSVTLTHGRTGRPVRVFVQDCHCDDARARQLIGG